MISKGNLLTGMTAETFGNLHPLHKISPAIFKKIQPVILKDTKYLFRADY